MQTEKFSLKKRIKSFYYAFSGIKIAVKTQHNLQIHLIAVFIVLIFGFLLKINVTEWLILIIIFSLVISSEIINSAIELITDIISPEYNIKAGKVKDMAAGAVLINAIAALIIGIIIFAPKIIQLIF
jgi:diacylglycerol kinase